MPIDDITINERSPPSGVVADGKEMTGIPEAATVRVRSDGDGWEVEATGTDPKKGPPFDVQAFVEKVKNRTGNGPVDFKPDPANNKVVVKYQEDRF